MPWKVLLQKNRVCRNIDIKERKKNYACKYAYFVAFLYSVYSTHVSLPNYSKDKRIIKNHSVTLKYQITLPLRASHFLNDLYGIKGVVSHRFLFLEIKLWIYFEQQDLKYNSQFELFFDDALMLLLFTM